MLERSPCLYGGGTGRWDEDRVATTGWAEGYGMWKRPAAVGMEKEGERDVGKMKVEADSTLKVAGDAEGTGGFRGLNTVISWGWQDSGARCRRALDVSGV